MHIHRSIYNGPVFPVAHFSSGVGLSCCCNMSCVLWFIGEWLCVFAESATVLQCQLLIFITMCLQQGYRKEMREIRNLRMGIFLYCKNDTAIVQWVFVHLPFCRRDRRRERGFFFTSVNHRWWWKNIRAREG